MEWEMKCVSFCFETKIKQNRNLSNFFRNTFQFTSNTINCSVIVFFRPREEKSEQIRISKTDATFCLFALSLDFQLEQ